MHKLPIELSAAMKILEVAWPAFVESDGCVLLRDGLAKSHGMEAIEDRTGREAFVNHVHILDLIDHPKLATPISAHALDLAWRLAVLIARIWGSKLRQEYPTSSFRIYATREDEPIVRFHRCYDSEAPWLESDGPVEEETGPVFVLEIHG